MARTPPRRGWLPARFASKEDLLTGGADVKAGIYSRASSDKRQVGRGKSPGEQTGDSRKRISRHGWTETAHYSDNDLSASEYSDKERPDWEKLLRRIARQDLDVLVLWELGRGQRDLEVYATVRKLCLRNGLYYWLIAGRLYDLRDRNDKLSLHNQAVQADTYSDAISEAVLRGMKGSADDGRPHSHPRYGYRRIYDERTGDYLDQVPDDTPRTATAADGTVTEYTRAGVVRRIFEDVRDTVGIKTIADRLDAAGIPGPGEANLRPKADGTAYTWHRSTIADMIRDPRSQVYLGHRLHYGEITKENAWEPLVDEGLFYAARNVLLSRAAPEDDGVIVRDARAKYLLSHIAVCECGKKFAGGWHPGKYRCQGKACSSIGIDDLDATVTAAMLEWFNEHDFTAGRGDEQDPELAAAQAREEKAAGKLADWQKQLDDPAAEIEPASYARREKALTKEAEDAKALVKELASREVPAVLVRMSENPYGTWAALELEQRRGVIRLAFDVIVARGKAGTYAADRLTLAPKYG